MRNEEKSDKQIDCSGLSCSLPLVESRMQLDKMKVGEKLEVIATSSSAAKDLEILTSLKAFELVRSWKKEDKFHFLIKKVQ